MTLKMTDAETSRLAHEVAALTGESVQEAVACVHNIWLIRALRRRIVFVALRRDDLKIREDGQEKGCAQLKVPIRSGKYVVCVSGSHYKRSPAHYRFVAAERSDQNSLWSRSCTLAGGRWKNGNDPAPDSRDLP